MGVLSFARTRTKITSLGGGTAPEVQITIETTFGKGEKRLHQLESVSRLSRLTCPMGF